MYTRNLVSDLAGALNGIDNALQRWNQAEQHSPSYIGVYRHHGNRSPNAKVQPRAAPTQLSAAL
jgi:hypothetical protein